MNSKTILCVDDDAQIRELIKAFLEGKGFKVMTSTDGWDCMREIIVRKPDLILLDVNMPKLDGLNALDMMKVAGVTQNTPVILVSGEGDATTVTKAAKLGADDFIVKPFSFEELYNRIQTHLFKLDFAGLKEWLKLAGAPVDMKTLQPAMDTTKFKEWKAYPVISGDKEGLILLNGGLSLENAMKLSDKDSRAQVVAMLKLRSHWKTLWPV